MLVNPNRKLLQHHIYNNHEIPLLKMAAIYGANGSGKSNFIAGFKLLLKFVQDPNIGSDVDFDDLKFKLIKENVDPIQLGVEFLKNHKLFQYTISLDNKHVYFESLTYKAGKDKFTVFERKFISENNFDINLYDTSNKRIESEEYNEILKSWSESGKINSFFAQESAWGNIFEKKNEHLKDAKEWFSKNINILYKNPMAMQLAKRIEDDEDLKIFTKDLLSKIGLEIVDIKVLVQSLNDLSTDEQTEIVANLSGDKKNMQNRSEEIFKDDNGIKRRTLELKHKGIDGYEGWIALKFQSTGTQCLLHLMPMIKDIINKECVYIVDEIDDSIHPLLISNLLAYIGEMDTKGQLIFNTHQQILLDQKRVLRPDEIWFVQKENGNSKMYSLSDFKEHNTIDIQKGYLSGRYKGIPVFNLNDSNNE